LLVVVVRRAQEQSNGTQHPGIFAQKRILR
jgi:hypothetical protein